MRLRARRIGISFRFDNLVGEHRCIDEVGGIDFQGVGNIKEYVQLETMRHVRSFNRADERTADTGLFRQSFL